MASGYTYGYTSSQSAPPRQGPTPAAYTTGYAGGPTATGYTSSTSNAMRWDPILQRMVYYPTTATYGPQGAAGYFGVNPTPGIVATAPKPPPAPKGPTAAEIAAKAARDAAAAQKAAQAKADAEAAAAKKKAGEGFLTRAGNLQGQIDALKYALGAEGFEKNLNQNLTDILANYEAGIGLLKEGHAARAQGFLGSAEDTEKATAQQAGSTFENLIRERQDTMSNLLLQGAGETDALRAMVMAARNYRDNLSEGNRAYFDSMRSIKSGLTDLNADTKASMTNSTMALESERERLWQDFYNKRSETYTQLGNTYGQQADYYLSAEENDVKSGGKKDTAANLANQAFMDAAKETGKSYVQQGVPTWLQQWQGIEAPVARQTNTDLAAAIKFEPIQQAEGAGLRSW